MTEFSINWYFGSRYAIFYINEEVTKGKYTFGKSIFDKEKYLQEKK